MAESKPLPARRPASTHMGRLVQQQQEEKRRASVIDRRLGQPRPDALRVHVGPDTPGETVGIAWLRPKRSDGPDEAA